MSLFKLNTQEVVEMLNGQWMPSPVQSLTSVIAITFVKQSKITKGLVEEDILGQAGCCA